MLANPRFYFQQLSLIAQADCKRVIAEGEVIIVPSGSFIAIELSILVVFRCFLLINGGDPFDDEVFVFHSAT